MAAKKIVQVKDAWGWDGACGGGGQQEETKREGSFSGRGKRMLFDIAGHKKPYMSRTHGKGWARRVGEREEERKRENRIGENNN